MNHRLTGLPPCPVVCFLQREREIDIPFCLCSNGFRCCKLSLARNDDFINPFSMRHDKDNGLLHDAIKILYVELTKLKNVINKPIEQMTDMEKF